MAQYPIPQFIEQEGKIVSFLTFKQFFVLVGGVGICFICYYALPLFLFVPIAIIVALGVGIVGFFKVNNTSLLTVILNYVAFTNQTKNYTWKKKESAYPFKIKRRAEIKDVPEALYTPQTQESRLDDARKIIEYKKK